MIRYFKNDIFTCHGDPVKILYSPVINDDGTISLVESGKENLDDYIASFASSVDIEQMIQRFVQGDFSALDKVKGSYGDFLDVPKTYAEFLQMQIDSRMAFDKLPVSIKQKFNNNSEEFVLKAGTEEWFNNLGIQIKSDVDSGSDNEIEGKEKINE